MTNEQRWNVEVLKAATLDATAKQTIRALSDQTLGLAQYLNMSGLPEGFELLIEVGLILRQLAGVPPPWEDTRHDNDVEQPIYAVRETDQGSWEVVTRGNVVATTKTNAEAWAWIDKHDLEHADACLARIAIRQKEVH